MTLACKLRAHHHSWPRPILSLISFFQHPKMSLRFHCKVHPPPPPPPPDPGVWLVSFPDPYQLLVHGSIRTGHVTSGLNTGSPAKYIWVIYASDLERQVPIELMHLPLKMAAIMYRSMVNHKRDSYVHVGIRVL